MSDNNKKLNKVRIINELTFQYQRVKDINEESVGKRVRDVRLALGISLEEMAEKLSLSYGGMRRLEKGEAIPNGRTLILLHEIYGVDIIWLLFGRHSFADDILSAIYSLDDKDRFDIFTRLYSYFVTKDNMALVPSFGRCEGVEHFAKWDQTFYRPLEHIEINGEDIYCDNKKLSEIFLINNTITGSNIHVNDEQDSTH